MSSSTAAPAATLTDAAPRRVAARRRWRPNVPGAIGTLVTLLLAATWAFPLYWAVVTSLKTESQVLAKPITLFPPTPNFEAYIHVLTRSMIVRWYFNSLFTALAVTFLVVLLCMLCGYAISQLSFPGKHVLYWLLLAGFMIPAQALIAPLFIQLADYGWVNSFQGIVLPQVIAPITIIIFKQFFDAMPHELRDSAVIDGAGEFRILNGLWEYAIRGRDEEQPAEFDGKILVPFPVESALSGVKRSVTPQDRLWYQRTFQRPPSAEGKRLLLHFGAVDWEARVWVNGHEAGVHRGGYDPFTFDITDLLNDSSDQQLVVSVWDPTDKGVQPRGKQVLAPQGIWYTAVTGIWQTVWLEAVPENYVRSLKMVPDIDAGVLKLTVDTASDARVWAEALDGERTIGRVEGAAGEPIVLEIPDAGCGRPTIRSSTI
jgi:hypothetical protein